MADQQAKSARVFYSYSHKDAAYRDELEKHLAALRRGGVIGEWSDRDITGGQEWAGQIDKNLEAADIILLLVSADFINSDYCYGKEMARALERHEAGTARVIPIILRPVDWESTPFHKLQALPAGAKPVTTWQNRDEAWVDVVQGIRRAIGSLPEGRTQGAVALAAYPQLPPPSGEVKAPTMGTERKPGKMSNAVKVASIGAAAVVVIAAVIGGILLYNSATGTARQTPTSAVTPSPTPTPSTPVLNRPGTPFLADPMMSPNTKDQWSVYNLSYASCGFHNGGYDVKVSGDSTGACTTNAPTTMLTNFIYEIDMTIMSGVTNVTRSTRGAGLQFRYNNDPNGVTNSNYGISFQQDGTYYLFAFNNGTLISLGTGPCASFHKGAQQTNLIDVEMSGPTMTLFVNSVYLTTATNPLFKSGQLGVQIASGDDAS
ncbi:MAG TPA: toll/interleukin-1 receptor domain-containing protein, partial [Ktedonobacterales bacterium]|nr:toll/interleukin-1 receptor domain-containing protein [Ktedonobacterales bacterium]